MTRRILLVLTAALLGSACEDATGPDAAPAPSVARVEVSAPAQALEVAGTVQLAATPRDAKGAPVAAAVTWSSSDPAVARVSASGLVTGVAAGNATITARAAGRQGQVALSVALPAIGWVEITPGGDLIQLPGSSRELGVVLHGAGGVELPARPVVWASGNESVVTVTPGGVLHAVSYGTAVITATVDGVTGEKRVNVPSEVTQLTLDLATVALGVGESITVHATARGANGAVLQRPATWTTLHSSVATVDSTGLVTARGVGQTVLTVQVEGKTATAQVVVSAWDVMPMVAIGDSALPTTAYDTVNAAGRRVRYQALDGLLRVQSNTGQFELLMGGWLHIDGQVSTPASLGARGSYAYDVFSGEFVFTVPGHPQFRGRRRADGRLEVVWRLDAATPAMRLVFDVD